MLCSVGDFIDTGIDDQMAAMQDSTLGNLDDIDEDEDLEQDEIQKWVVVVVSWWCVWCRIFSLAFNRQENTEGKYRY